MKPPNPVSLMWFSIGLSIGGCFVLVEYFENQHNQDQMLDKLCGWSEKNLSDLATELHQSKLDSEEFQKLMNQCQSELLSCHDHAALRQENLP
jgi:hypothetical protein